MPLNLDSQSDLQLPLTPGKNVEFVPTKPLSASWDSWHPFWCVMKDPSIGVIPDEACIFERPPTPGHNLELVLPASASKISQNCQVTLNDQIQNDWDSKIWERNEGSDYLYQQAVRFLPTESTALPSMQALTYNANLTANNPVIPAMPDPVHWLSDGMDHEKHQRK